MGARKRSMRAFALTQRHELLAPRMERSTSIKAALLILAALAVSACSMTLAVRGQVGATGQALNGSATGYYSGEVDLQNPLDARGAMHWQLCVCDPPPRVEHVHLQRRAHRPLQPGLNRHARHQQRQLGRRPVSFTFGSV